MTGNVIANFYAFAGTSLAGAAGTRPKIEGIAQRYSAEHHCAVTTGTGYYKPILSTYIDGVKQ